jgi:hypothetical protein
VAAHKQREHFIAPPFHLSASFRGQSTRRRADRTVPFAGGCPI